MAHSKRRSGTWLGKAFGFARNRALKLAADVAAWRLDAELAADVDPRGGARLRARAAVLVSPKHRRRVAVTLLRLVNESRAVGPRSFSAAVPVSRDQVADAREALAFAAQVLLFAEQVGARGVAMIEQLLHDGGSVLYVGGEPGALEARLEEALHHLVLGERRPDAGPGRPVSHGVAGGRR